MKDTKYRARVDQLINEIDDRTSHKNLTLGEQPPETWSQEERLAWSTGYLAGQHHIVNAVRRMLQKFVREDI